MPSGTYLHLGDQLARPERIEERFQCGPGAGGWRYVGERTDGCRADITVDGRWRQIRVELASAGLRIRGGTVGRRELLWARSGEEVEHSATAAGFIGDSPGFLVAVARSLRLEPGEGLEPGEDAVVVPLVHVRGPALATLTVTYRWRLAEVTTYDTDFAPLPVERYEITDLATGEPAVVHLAGDIVIDAPGIELTGLTAPPTLP